MELELNRWERIPSNAPLRLEPDDLYILYLLLLQAQEMSWSEAHKDDAFATEAELDELSERILHLYKRDSVYARLRRDGFDALELTPRQASVLHLALKKALPEIELFDDFQSIYETSSEHAWELFEIIESVLGVPEADRMHRPSAAELVRRRKLHMAEWRRRGRLLQGVLCRGRLERVLTWPVDSEPLFPLDLDADDEIETSHVAEKILAYIRSVQPLTSVKRDGGEFSRFWSRLEVFPASSEQASLDLVFLGEGCFGYKVGDARLRVRLARSSEEMENLALAVVRSARGWRPSEGWRSE